MDTITGSGWNNTTPPFVGLVKEFLDARTARKEAEAKENQEHAERVKNQALAHQSAASRIVGQQGASVETSTSSAPRSMSPQFSAAEFATDAQSDNPRVSRSGF